MGGPRDADPGDVAGGTRPTVRAEEVAERVRRLVDQFRCDLATGEARVFDLDDPGGVVALLAQLRVETPSQPTRPHDSADCDG